jgi:hypothetical protein
VSSGHCGRDGIAITPHTDMLVALGTLPRRARTFLIVGSIASIKEIVVLSVKAAENTGSGESFRDQLW